MKKDLMHFVLLMGLLFGLTSIHAQEKTILPAADRATYLTQWMKNNLQLTEEQVPQVQEINLIYANKVDESWHTDQSQADKLKILKTENQLREDKLQKIFTGEQLKTYQSKKEERRKMFKEEIKQRRKPWSFDLDIGLG